MLTLIIVDDEPLERIALKKIISTHEPDIKIIGEAPNGRMAIEMAKEHQPDLMLMDIKMPGIDGVEAVKQIRKISPTTKFIMVSAFDTFEYAKEVMQQGVKEYVLKPSRSEDILGSIARVKEEIYAEREQKRQHERLKEHLHRAITMAQTEWLSALLLDQIQDIRFEEWSEFLGIEVDAGYVAVFSFKPSHDNVTKEEKMRWYRWLKNYLRENSVHEHILGVMTETKVPVLFFCQTKEERSIMKANIQSLVRPLIQQFKQTFDQTDVAVGIGLLYEDIEKINQSYHEALLALEQIPQDSHVSYAFASKQMKQDWSVKGLLEVEKELLEAVRKGDLFQALEQFERYYETITSNHEEKMEELFILLSRMMMELGTEYERRTFPSGDSLKEAAKAELTSVVQIVQAWRNSRAKGLMMKAKEYIDEHFAEAITLEEAAEHVGLSPYYFSKLFKDRFGITFIDYITEIRMKRAKELMENPDVSVKEVCYTVGYKDPNYFSRVFKKYTGLTPSEYRKGKETRV
jgi:two-component system, response regulator YesN